MQMIPGRTLLVLATALSLPLASAARAADPAGARTSLQADVYGRVAPSGVMLVTGLARRWGFDDQEGILLQGRYLEIGASVGVNPAYAQAGPHLEWIPIAPLQLRVQYDIYGFFGSNGALLRFPSASSRFGDDEIKALRGSETTGLGQRLLLTPVLRARVGRLVLRSQTDIALYALASEPGWYYEWEYDTLLSNRDVLVSNRTALLFELWHGSGEAALLAGPAYEVTHAAKADINRQRIEGVLFWSPADAAGWLARPRILLAAGVNLVDRNRQGNPFAVLGVGADLDL